PLLRQPHGFRGEGAAAGRGGAPARVPPPRRRRRLVAGARSPGREPAGPPQQQGHRHLPPPAPPASPPRPAPPPGPPRCPSRCPLAAPPPAVVTPGGTTAPLDPGVKPEVRGSGRPARSGGGSFPGEPRGPRPRREIRGARGVFPSARSELLGAVVRPSAAVP